MSHVVQAKTLVRDRRAAVAAAEALGHSVLGEQTFDLYERAVTGLGVKFAARGRNEAWKFPIVCEEGGQVQYDNYNGAWGDVATLDEFLAQYAVETTRLEAVEQGWALSDVVIEGDELVLTAEVF